MSKHKTWWNVNKYESIDLRELFTPEVIAKFKPALISEMLLGVQPMSNSAFESAHKLMKFPENPDGMGSTTQETALD